MRELTKSMTSFSWAMSLFGLRQMACLLDPRSWGSSASTFQAVTRSTEEQLGPTTQSLFRAGDNLQRGLVDLMFNLFTLGFAGSGRGRGDNRWRGDDYGRGGDRGCRSGGDGDTVRRSVEWGADVLERSAEAGADVMQRSAQAGADVVRQSVGAAGSGTSRGTQGDIGWGPMPGGQ